MQERRFGDRVSRGDALPAYDAYAYVAMAEHPAFFTVSPWGYRVLTAWLVAALPVRPPQGFRLVTLGGLAVAAVLLFLLLRRLGCRDAAALPGVAAFLLSGPVAALLKNPFLADPVTLALALALLLALEAGAGAPVLALVGALGALSKEYFLLLLPLLFLARRARDRPTLPAAFLAALPALALVLILRFWWTPHLPPALPAIGPSTLGAAVENLGRFWNARAHELLLSGLTPLALLGALRTQAKPLVRRYALLLGTAFCAPFFNPVVFSPGDVPRLIVYALPGLIPLALLAVDRVWPLVSPPPPLMGRRPRLDAAAAAATAAIMLFSLAALDRYRRSDLRQPRDGPLLLATCRESLRAARRLERGNAISFDIEPGDPGELRSLPWFLRGGWVQRAPEGRAALLPPGLGVILVPTLIPSDREIILTMSAAGGGRVAVTLNGRPAGHVWPGAGARDHALLLPGSSLYRGDNLLKLAWGGPGALQLHRLALRPSGAPSRMRPRRKGGA